MVNLSGILMHRDLQLLALVGPLARGCGLVIRFRRERGEGVSSGSGLLWR